MIKQLMNNLLPAATKMATKPPVTPMVNHFSSAATHAAKPAAVMNPHHQLAAELKSGAVKFTPDKPARPGTATKCWSA